MEGSEKHILDGLPKELLVQIVCYLDNKSLLAFRTAKKLYWTRFIITDFNISDEVDFSDVCQQLLRYHPTLVGLTFSPKRPQANGIALLENISILSNLSALITSVRPEADEQMWLKLTNLTNLYNCDWASSAPSSLVLQYWTNLTWFDSYQEENPHHAKHLVKNLTRLREVIMCDYSVQSKEIFNWNTYGTVTKLSLGCYSSLREANFNGIQNFSRLKELRFSTEDNTENLFPFSELRELQYLEVGVGMDYGRPVDLSHNTNLTFLSGIRGNNSFTNLVKLRHLEVEIFPPMADNTFFSALTDLEGLGLDLNFGEGVDPHFLESLSTRVKSLRIFTEHQVYYGALSRLTNLRDLTIYENQPFEASGKIDLVQLRKLVYLDVKTFNTIDYVDVAKVTSLQSLDMHHLGDELTLPISLSALTNLGSIALMKTGVPNLEADLINMTNLEQLNTSFSETDDYSFFEFAPIRVLYVRNHLHSKAFWPFLARCTTLETLTHSCASPEHHIGQLTTLTKLTYMALDYSGKLSEDHLDLLTSINHLYVKCLDNQV